MAIHNRLGNLSLRENKPTQPRCVTASLCNHAKKAQKKPRPNENQHTKQKRNETRANRQTCTSFQPHARPRHLELTSFPLLTFEERVKFFRNHLVSAVSQSQSARFGGCWGSPASGPLAPSLAHSLTLTHSLTQPPQTVSLLSVFCLCVLPLSRPFLDKTHDHNEHFWNSKVVYQALRCSYVFDEKKASEWSA